MNHRPQIADDFGFTSDHALLRSTARKLLSERCPMSEVRRLVDDKRGYAPALMDEIAELGWTGLVIPERYGGAELDLLSMAILMEETGRCLLPGPFSSSVFASIAIGELGNLDHQRRLLPDLASGKTRASVATCEPAAWETIGATATVDGEGYRLRGQKSHVLWAEDVHLVIAPFRLDGDVAVFAVPRETAGVRVESEIGVDSTRRCSRMFFDGAFVAGSARLTAADAETRWQRVRARGCLLLAAEMVGAAEAIFAKTREYAIGRVQFKRAIGSFQAVKHPLVNVMIAIEKARSLVAGAAAAVDGESADADLLSRAAKASAEHALSFAADRGVQFHGGYGFTWDCDAHFFMKRALWSAATLGDARHHRAAIAAALLDA